MSRIASWSLTATILIVTACSGGPNYELACKAVGRAVAAVVNGQQHGLYTRQAMHHLSESDTPHDQRIYRVLESYEDDPNASRSGELLTFCLDKGFDADDFIGVD